MSNSSATIALFIWLTIVTLLTPTLRYILRRDTWLSTPLTLFVLGVMALTLRFLVVAYALTWAPTHLCAMTVIFHIVNTVNTSTSKPPLTLMRTLVQANSPTNVDWSSADTKTSCQRHDDAVSRLLMIVRYLVWRTVIAANILIVNRYLPSLLDFSYIRTMLHCMLIVSGVQIVNMIPVIITLVLSAHCHAEDVFGHVLSVTTVSQFWRTWNRPIHQIFIRFVYGPLGARRSLMLSVTAVGLISSALHEYLVWIWNGRLTFRMTLFFLAQSVIIVVENMTVRYAPAILSALSSPTRPFCSETQLASVWTRLKGYGQLYVALWFLLVGHWMFDDFGLTIVEAAELHFKYMPYVSSSISSSFQRSCDCKFVTVV